MTAGIFEQLPAGFQMWSPTAQAATLFLSTFVLEDVAAVGAGLLLAAGVLAWPVAFGACFMGIWIGDAGLYGFARVVGRNWFERTSLKRFSGRVEQSEQWFAQRGNWILVFSRLMPGARLPTYLAAGFLRLPLNRFLLITGTASLLWTVIVLLTVNALGTKVLLLLEPLRKSGWILLASGLMVFLVLEVAKRSATLPRLKRLLTPVERWSRWEFWPAWLFYAPVGFYYLWLAIKYRGLTVPTAANPGIFSGGIIGESKIATLQSLMERSPEFTAEAELVAGSCRAERLASVREICDRRKIRFPFVLKPDLGQRGAGVKLLHNEAQAIAYLNQTEAPLLLQRNAPGPREVGIFYFRFPSESRGRIFAITEKVFPTLTGDGQATISELIWADPRARFMAGKYLKRLKGREHEVLPAGENLKLVQAGNHAQGCIFRDGMNLCTPELVERIDAISQKLSGFYVGRYDIRYTNEEDLAAGRNFQIVELNGAASEATSIYDERNSIFAAYRTLFRQWELVFGIGAANRQKGTRTTEVSLIWRRWRDYVRFASTYPAAD